MKSNSVLGDPVHEGQQQVLDLLDGGFSLSFANKDDNIYFIRPRTKCESVFHNFWHII